MVLPTTRLALRSLARQPLHTAINLIGLSIGLAAAILIFLYSYNELTYNSTHEKRDSIHLVIKERHLPSGVQELWDTWMPLRDQLVSDYPEVVSGARIFSADLALQVQEQSANLAVSFVDAEFFDLFSLPFESGNNQLAWTESRQAVLSSELAERLYGEADPIGEDLAFGEGGQPFVVAGVLEPLPRNSSFDFELLLPFEAGVAMRELSDSGWDRSFLMTFLELEQSASVVALEEKLPDTVEKLFGSEGPNGRGSLYFRLIALPDLHDWLTGNRMMARVLFALSLVILFIVGINFTNLSAASALRRAREVGVRKVMGADRRSLALRFLLESVLLALLATAFAVLLVEVAIPVMNRSFQLDIALDIASGAVWIRLLGLALVVGLAAGLFPALHLSRFSPVRTLRGDLGSARSGRRFRQLLVGLQFALSIGLIVGTAVIWQQLHFMKNAQLKLDAEQVLALPYDLQQMGEPEQAFATLETVANELARLPGVQQIALSSGVPGSFVRTNVFVEPENWESDVPLRMAAAAMDEQWYELYDVQLLAGRRFDPARGREAEEAVIFNRTAVSQMGLTPEQAIGTRVEVAGLREVVGVVEDFHFARLTERVRPVAMVYRGVRSGFNSFVSVRLGAGPMQQTLAKIEALWEDVAGVGAVDWFFVDERMRSGYDAQERSATLASFFAGLAIFIAALGLVGLVSATVTSRTREIGVRKVLGATVAQVVRAIGTPYILPVLLASLLAWPSAWLLLRAWLENYPYRVSPSPWLFAAGTLLALLVAGFTIVLTTLKPARSNPVSALRDE